MLATGHKYLVKVWVNRWDETLFLAKTQWYSMYLKQIHHCVESSTGGVSVWVCKAHQAVMIQFWSSIPRPSARDQLKLQDYERGSSALCGVLVSTRLFGWHCLVTEVIAVMLVLKAKILVLGLDLDASSPWPWPCNPSPWPWPRDWSFFLALALNAWYDFVFDTSRKWQKFPDALMWLSAAIAAVFQICISF